MARIARQKITRWVDASGKRVKPNAPGARKIVEESRKWYAFDVPGQTRRIPLATNKDIALVMLANLIRKTELDEAERDSVDVPREYREGSIRIRQGRATYNPHPLRPMVYFARHGTDGPIKIGHTTNVPSRLESLQTGCHEELQLLGTVPGGQKRERQIHQQFAAARIRGEWFRATSALLTFIKNNCTDYLF